MQSLSKFNKGASFLLCVIDIFSKYKQTWVVPLKDKKSVTIVSAFQKNQIIQRENQTRYGQTKEVKFTKVFFKKCLKDNDIEMYSIHNKGKSVVDERFIRTLKTKVYEYMTSVSKNIYIDKLDDIVNEQNNTYHRTIKMKPVDVKENAYIDLSKEVNDKDSKFQVGDHVRISKYKNIFTKGYTQNWSEEVFLITEVKSTVSWAYVISNLNGEKIIGTFFEKQLQERNQQTFRIEKVIKREGNKLYVKWKEYDNSFDSQIDKKDVE